MRIITFDRFKPGVTHRPRGLRARRRAWVVIAFELPWVRYMDDFPLSRARLLESSLLRPTGPARFRRSASAWRWERGCATTYANGLPSFRGTRVRSGEGWRRGKRKRTNSNVAAPHVTGHRAPLRRRMDLKLGGKRALVTGSSSGIGAAIARRLAGEGARVVIHGRHEARARGVAEEIARDGGEARIALGDVTTDAGVSSVVAAVRASYGAIDILVNCAGSYGVRQWFNTTPDTWRRFYEDDVISAVRMIQAFAPPMREGSWGRIVNIATGLATYPGPDLADYAAAKAALINATVSLARALAGTGVGACTVSPGLILTEPIRTILLQAAKEKGWGDDWNVVQARWFAEVLGSTTVKRLGTVAEIADLVTYLASPLAEYVVGANVRIDGGLTPSVN